MLSRMPVQETQETQVWSLDQEDPWKRACPPTPVFLPGESDGQRSLASYSPWGLKESDTTEHTHIGCKPNVSCVQVVCVTRWLMKKIEELNKRRVCPQLIIGRFDTSLNSFWNFLCNSLINIFYWSMVDLQCFRYTARWFSYTYTHILFLRLWNSYLKTKKICRSRQA